MVRLDLGSHTSSSHTSRAAALQSRENRGDGESSKAEPQEGGGSLRFTAAAGLVAPIGTVSDFVGAHVALERLVSAGIWYKW